MCNRKVLYPNVYTEDERKCLERFVESAKNVPTYNIENNSFKMKLYAKCWDQWNPLFNDDKYGKTTRYRGVIAIPCYAEPIGFGMLGKEMGIPTHPDYAYIGDGYDHEFRYYKPIYGDEELAVSVIGASYMDITPSEGSEIRGIILIIETEMKNSAGEVVGAGTLRWPEFRCQYNNVDDIPQNEDMLDRFAGEYQHPAYRYTQEDWKTIQSIWEKEKIRGKEVLYWEDVEVGDEPAWTTEGPVTTMDMIRLHGGSIVGGKHVKDYVCNNKGRFAEIEGVYYEDNFPHFMDHHGLRPKFVNVTGRNFIIRMVTNWCGDDGFVSKVAWRLINDLPPEKQKNHFPEEHKRPSYLLKVPYLKSAGRYMNTHGAVMDCAIAKGYVVEKYFNESGHFVELACWAEDLKGNIFAEASIEVKLLSKEDV